MVARFGSLDGDADLDRFNRVVTSKWTKDITAPAADVDFFNVAVGWDRNSNVTYQDDSVHDAFGAAYTNDDLNRLIVSAEGLGTGGTISTLKRKQEWTLTQTGNWTLDKLDLNGDADWSDTDEWQDGRTHNDVNELTARDLDNNSGTGGDNYSLAYDAAGNLTDDGTDYEYEWDAFYRLRKVKRTDNQALVAEYRYNGLGYRIAEHADTDTDGDVDGNDKWFYFAYDNRWRLVATFRESDTSPKEEFVHHHAGMRGSGSYIDLVAFRDKDANTAWTTASDTVLEERLYYAQNWRADVVAIVSSSAVQKEQARYSAYGVPFGLPAGDADSDGDCDAADGTIVTAWKVAPTYDVRGDIDLDGDLDATDESAVAGMVGAIGGRGCLSMIGGYRGFAGYVQPLAASTMHFTRDRGLSSRIGVWLERDPSEYIDGQNLYQYARLQPVIWLDPSGRYTAKTDGQTNTLPPVAIVIDPKKMHDQHYDPVCKDLAGDNGSGGKPLDVWCCSGSDGKKLDNSKWENWCRDQVRESCQIAQGQYKTPKGKTPPKPKYKLIGGTEGQLEGISESEICAGDCDKGVKGIVGGTAIQL